MGPLENFYGVMSADVKGSLMRQRLAEFRLGWELPGSRSPDLNPMHADDTGNAECYNLNSPALCNVLTGLLSQNNSKSSNPAAS